MNKAAINQRFKNVVETLKNNGILKFQNSLSESLGIHKQTISDILTGKRNLTIEHLTLLLEKFSVNPIYMLSNEGPMFIQKETIKNNIRYVPIKVQAGYGEQIHGAIFENTLEEFHIPGHHFNDGDYRCFEVEGDSMEPTYFNNDRVICSQLPNAYMQQALKDNMTYIIVTDSSLLLKRVHNKIKENQTIELISDNSFYDLKTLHINEVKEVWKVEGLITSRIPSGRKKDI